MQMAAVPSIFCGPNPLEISNGSRSKNSTQIHLFQFSCGHIDCIIIMNGVYWFSFVCAHSCSFSVTVSLIKLNVYRRSVYGVCACVSAFNYGSFNLVFSLWLVCFRHQYRFGLVKREPKANNMRLPPPPALSLNICTGPDISAYMFVLCTFYHLCTHNITVWYTVLMMIIIAFNASSYC